MISFRLATLFCLLSIVCTAQISEYNFQDYRQAETRIQSLILLPQLSGRHGETGAALFNTDEQYDNANFNLSLLYSDLSNSEDRQNSLIASTRVAPSYSRLESQGEKTTTTGIQSSLNLTWVRDNYKNYNQAFWGWSASATLAHSVRKRNAEGSNPFDVNSRQFSMTVLPQLRLGWGRMENITNAWRAYRILNRLHFVEMIDDQSIDRINQFGNYLDEVLAIRVYDGRLGYITQLRLIDNFLDFDMELGIEPNMKYFVELNDMWRYGISENRIKGRKFTTSIGPLGSINDAFEEINGIDDTLFEQGLGVQINLEYLVGKPLKGLYQLNYQIDLLSRYMTSMTDPNIPSREMDRLTVSPGANVLFGYYPTTRTEYELFGEVRYSYQEIYSDFNDTVQQDDLIGSIRGCYEVLVFSQNQSIGIHRF